MDFSLILDGLASQGIWCLLFVWLFWTDRNDSREREQKLTAIIEEHGEQLEKITSTLDKIDERIERIEKDH